jgi:NAD(P)-dependent dehydrogenase (short-subunit alcohol dehydrogenase family)
VSTVLITGTSTGIGRETALLLARRGHTVYATMRRPESAGDLKQLAEQENLPLSLLRLDVEDDASVREAFDRVYSEQQQLDVLVNNAGISFLGPIEELELDSFRQAMETNFFGTLRCIKAVLSHMRAQGSGCIINVSSVAGRVATSPQGAYAASKFAMEAISEILAQEVRGFGIRVAIIEPGFTSTAIFEKDAEATRTSPYPQERRFRAVVAASLQHATGSGVVAEQIRKVIEEGTSQLRYPVGRDARTLFAWRKMISDEEWVERNAIPDDEEWLKRVFQESGVDLRNYL